MLLNILCFLGGTITGAILMAAIAAGKER